MLLPPKFFSFKKIIRLLLHKYSLRKRNQQNEKVSMRQTCFIMPDRFANGNQNDSDAATKKNTIAIYPAEDTAATFKG
jgi:hypothetical protein